MNRKGQAFRLSLFLFLNDQRQDSTRQTKRKTLRRLLALTTVG